MHPDAQMFLKPCNVNAIFWVVSLGAVSLADKATDSFPRMGSTMSASYNSSL